MSSQESLPAERPATRLEPFEPSHGESEADDGVSLRGYWRVLVKRQWTVLVFLSITVALTATATFLTTPIYRATTMLQIDREAPKVVKYEAVTPAETDTFDPQFYQTQYDLLKSRSLAERVVEQLNLAQHPAFQGDQGRSVLGLGAEAGAQEAATDPREVRSGLVARLLDSLTVEPIRNSKLVKIHYDSPDPALAAQIVQVLAGTFIQLSLERRFDAASYAKNFLEQRLAQVKGRLEDSEQALVAFARSQGILNVNVDVNVDDKKQTLAMQKLQAMSAALAEAGKERIAAESLYREALAAQGHGLSRILDNWTINRLKQAKVELEALYQEQGVTLKPDHPKMQQIRSRITEVEDQIGREIGAIHGALRGDFQAAQRKEAMLNSETREVTSEVMRLRDQTSQYNILMREVDTNRTLYDGLLQRLKEVGIVGGVSLNNLSVIDAAEVPKDPIRPNVRLNLVLGILSGLLGGIGLAFLFEHLDDTVMLPEDLERLAQLPVLGILPELPSSTAATLATSAYDDPRSAVAEATRSLRTALLFSTPEHAPRVLHITSPGLAEGKTTISLNLAITFTQLGHKVLLIDCDLRRPALHRVLDLDSNRGLTHYLTSDSIRPSDVTQYPHIPNLFAIPAGPVPPNPAELLGSARMVDFLALAAKKVDYVLLDGPPILGLADGLILASLAHGTVVVVEAAATRRDHLIGALKRLAGSQARVLGGVFNKLSRRDSAYSYYHSYYYYGNEAPPERRLPA